MDRMHKVKNTQDKIETQVDFTQSKQAGDWIIMFLDNR